MLSSTKETLREKRPNTDFLLVQNNSEFGPDTFYAV